MRALIPILMVLLSLISTSAYAVQTIIEYELPTDTCEGTTIDPSVIAALEIYIDTQHIPAVEINCPQVGTPTDVPPSGLNVVNAVPSDGSVTIDLVGGQTYYIRARVQDQSGDWSNLSGQHIEEVPRSPLNVPVIIRMTF